MRPLRWARCRENGRRHLPSDGDPAAEQAPGTVRHLPPNKARCGAELPSITSVREQPRVRTGIQCDRYSLADEYADMSSHQQLDRVIRHWQALEHRREELGPGPWSITLPDVPVRELVFGTNSEGTVTYLALEQQHEIHVLLVSGSADLITAWRGRPSVAGRAPARFRETITSSASHRHTLPADACTGC
ncbi:MAG: hypothetical protein ACRDTD_18145 [Pseudonocardiaceae bacterium]